MAGSLHTTFKVVPFHCHTFLPVAMPLPEELLEALSCDFKCYCHSIFHLFCWLEPVSLQEDSHSWKYVAINRGLNWSAQRLWKHSDIILAQILLYHKRWISLWSSQFPDSQKWGCFIAGSFQQMVKNVSVQGLDDIMLFHNELLQWSPHRPPLPYNAHRSSSSDCWPSLKCLNHLYTTACSTSFTDHVKSLWECLAQSYTNLSVCSFFKQLHSSGLGSKCNKVFKTKHTLLPFTPSVHSLSAHTRKYHHPHFPYILTYDMRTDTSTVFQHLLGNFTNFLTLSSR